MTINNDIIVPFVTLAGLNIEVTSVLKVNPVNLSSD